MQATSYAYYREIFSGIPMPYAFVDLDLFDENAKSILRRSAGKPVRVASKSVRVRSLLERVLRSSNGYQGIMTFSAEETTWLSSLGFDNLLLAYPCWNNDAIEGICKEVGKGKRILIMLDSPAHAEHYQSIAKRVGVTLPVCMDLDLSVHFPGLHFGVNRSPVNTAAKALELWKVIEKMPHLRLEGLMGYEAQIAGLGDDVPGMNIKAPVVRLLKKRSVQLVKQRREETVHALKQAGAPLSLVNGGGTGSLETTTQEACVTELTAGSGLFSSHLFDYYRQFRHLPAAAYAIEVARIPKPGIFTCLGGGYVASGSLGIEKLPKPYLPVGVTLLENEGAGEVQTPVAYSGQEKIQLGDPIFMRHSKAGELCERFNSVFLVQDGKIADQVATYRGEGKAFL